MATQANINAAKRLAARYNSITQKEIRTMMATLDDTRFSFYLLEKLTGYHACSRCPLCVSVRSNLLSPIKCKDCIYWDKNLYGDYPENRMHGFCNDGPNEKTFKAIGKARTVKGLVIAYRRRAKHILTRLKELGE